MESRPFSHFSQFRTGIVVLAAIGVLGSQHLVAAGEADAAFEQLANQYESQRQKLIEAYQSAKTEEEWAKVVRELDPDNVLLDSFFELEQAHRKSNAALSALYHIVVATSGRLDPDSPLKESRRRALQILKDHYASNPDLDYVVWILTPTSTDPEQQALLKVAEIHPEPGVRAMALLNRAERKRYEVKGPETIDARLELHSSDPRKHAAEIARMKEVRRKNYEGVIPEASRQEALTLVKQIADEYADLLLPPRPGRSPVLLPQERKRIDPLTKTPRRSYGEMAEAIRFQLTHLGIGSEAPDISGPDVFGEKRSLHDQRGKVVVLMFSFTGCGPCEEMYPDNRALLKEYASRPFAFLGVMGDESVETVKKSIADGSITWPIWWDGSVDGPISNRWGVEGWPEIYVIDHEGVIRYRGLRGEALAMAVKKLITEAEQAE